MGNVLQGLQERIAQSTKAKAIERAWQVAKALEADRTQIENLTWIQPVREDDKGIRRKIDFSSEFPEGVETLLPLQMDFQVIAPAKKLVPGENFEFSWTMPYLVRVTNEKYEWNHSVGYQLGTSSTPRLRPTIDIVTFLPFPRTDAPAEEQFKPEFGFTLNIRDPTSNGDYFYGCVAKFGDKTVKQFILGEYRDHLIVQADPYNDTFFSGNMLVNMSPEELTTVTPDSGYVELYVGRNVKGIDYSKIYKELAKVTDFPSTSRGFDSFGGGFKGGETLGFGDGLRGLTGLPRLYNQTSKRPTPAEAPKEVGEVKVGEGTKGEAQNYRTVSGYQFDSTFPVQRIRIRVLGVREGTQDQVRGELERIASTYQT